MVEEKFIRDSKEALRLGCRRVKPNCGRCSRGNILLSAKNLYMTLINLLSVFVRGPEQGTVKLLVYDKSRIQRLPLIRSNGFYHSPSVYPSLNSASLLHFVREQDFEPQVYLCI